MKPRAPDDEKDSRTDLKVFEALPAKVKELALLKDQAEKSTGNESRAINEQIRRKSKPETPRDA